MTMVMGMFGQLLLGVSIFGFLSVFVSVVKEKAGPALSPVPRWLVLVLTSAYFKLRLRQSFSSRERFLPCADAKSSRSFVEHYV